MKRILRSAGVLLVISALFTPAAQAYLTVSGNGTAPATANGTTFALALSKAVFFRPTGEYYFGQVAGANGNYSLCYASYRTADTAPTLTALGTTAPLLNALIDQLAVVPNSALVTSPTIVSAVGAAANVCINLSAVSKTSLTPVQAIVGGLAALGDTGAPAANAGIRALAASRSATTGANVVFAAVKINAAGATTPFGAGVNAAAGAGLATDGINAALITQTAGVPAWTSVGATATANQARAVDCSTTGSFALGAAAAVTAMQGVNPPFCYDEQLGRLYVGIQGQIAAQGGGNVGAIFGVGIYPVTITAGTSVAVGAGLQVNGSAASAILGLGANTIVGVNSLANAIATTNILGLKTMHTSTGMAYLIVNGNSSRGAVEARQVSNQIFAVPLVNVGAAVTADVGCFANVNSGQRILKAGAAGAVTDLITSASPATLVGGTGILPVAFGESATAAGGGGILSTAVTDMYVDGDAVYVATGIQDPTLVTISEHNETGLWKSQCVFNDLGQIDHWTDWQKVAPNDLGGNTAGGTASTGADPRISFAAVDSYTGHIWAINNTSLKAKVTQWTQPTATPNSQELLASAINSALGTACYSVLDLNASVTGWGAANGNQVTLFGGQEKVCFAITGSRNGATLGATAVNGTYTSLNTIIANSFFDYTQTSTFYTTSLPSGAGAVVSLGFSGWDPDANGTTQGFFFAGCAGTTGTAPGLYVFTPAGTTGFNTNTAGMLLSTTSLFTALGLPSAASAVAATGTWQRIANVSGLPIKIQGLGGNIHVLTRSATIDRIYSCSKVNTFALLNSSFVVTASSGNTPTAGSANSNLAAVKQIYDFVVSVSALGNVQPNVDAVNGVEQLIMLTNDGIYTTSSLQGMQTLSTNLSQLNAGWVRIDGTSSVVTSGFFSNYIAAPTYNRNPMTYWFANYAVNPAIASVYNKNIQYQMSRHSYVTGDMTLTNALTYAADPNTTATFDGATSFNQTTAPTIYANFPVLYRLFYNDGARRFFIQKNPNDDTKYQVLVLPYNLYDYNITANGKAPMSDAVVAQAGAFYWMSLIGDTGRLMMGTSSGVISLQ